MNSLNGAGSLRLLDDTVKDDTIEGQWLLPFPHQVECVVDTVGRVRQHNTTLAGNNVKLCVQYNLWNTCA